MVEEKIARICWSTNLWQKPSGPEGKSRNKKAYEYITGYGHEEWLLDTEKTIDGYHYSCLQAIGAHRDKYIGKKFNISLYSINNNTKERWWIGEIKNVEITTQDESKKIYKIYKRNKWLKEMESQLADVNADIKDDLKKHLKNILQQSSINLLIFIFLMSHVNFHLKILPLLQITII